MENYISDTSWNGQMMQSTLESQLASIPNQQLFHNDEEDVFQCGKCKMVLPSIIDFMIHKREHNLVTETNTNAEVITVTQEPIDLVSLNDNQIWLWSDNTDFPQTITMPEQNIIIQAPDKTLIPDNTMDQETIEIPNIEEVPSNNVVVDTFMQPQEMSPRAFNYVCTFCSKEFVKQSDYMQHYRVHTGEKPFQCPVCGRTFAQKSNKKKHMSTHKIWPNDLSKIIPPETGEVGYNCPFCEQAFTSYFSLKAHLITHKDRKVFKCIQTHCDAMFYDETSLLNHVTESHPVPSYRCHVCSLHLNSLDDFAEHQKTHTEYLKSNGSSKPIEKYRCLVCKVYFRTPESLANHSATATHKHECHVCNKNYTSARCLRRHLLVHNNTTTYACEICNKTFQSETSWKNHKLIHNPVKQHYCSQCHRSFTRKDKLLRHALIHQPNKKLKCPFNTYFGCTKEFHRQDKLKRHLLTHTKVPGQKRRGRKKNKPSEDNIEDGKMLENEQQVKTVEILVVPSNENWPDDIQITCPEQE